MTALLLLSVVLTTVELEDRVRDRTVEEPYIAGFFAGLTLGACSACRHGNGVVRAGDHDPFAMTAAARAELQRLGRTPYLIGVVSGGGLTFLLIGGVIFRTLNTLWDRSPLWGLADGTVQRGFQR